MVRSIAFISNQAFSLINFRGPLIQALARRGVKVYALAPDFDNRVRTRVIALGAKPIDCSLSRAGMNPARDIVDVARLWRILRRLNPDVTLAYFIKPVIYGSIAAWLAGVPRRFSIVEGLGYVFIENDGAVVSMHRRLLRYSVSRLYRLALRLNQKTFFLNGDDIALFTNEGVVVGGQVARLNGIGLDLDHYAPVPPVLTPVTFLLIARMLKEKGVYEFVEAARKVRECFPDTCFVLVGGTDANPGSIKEEELKGWVKEGLVEWPGQVEDVRPWIARSSVFVLPSYYREGMPRGNQEAMAMARPVITTDWIGCRETVQDGANGYLVPIRNPNTLAQTMQRFVESPDLIEKMGREGRRIAEERFDAQVINRQMLEIMGL